ncbi:MAG: TadE/TadG family protein [Sphingomonadales bacterium]|nr:TadE/TadG family protein [Sphingomonadales bacterium]
MPAPIIVARLTSLLSRFRRSSGGNIAITFAIALLPLLGFVGAAVDYTRAASARSAMQVALDSAALMIAKDDATGSMTATQVTAKARAYFLAVYSNTDAANIGVAALYSNTPTVGSQIVLTGTATVATAFMKVLGTPTLNLNISSTAAWGMTKLRVAMALDNTGSMSSDNKMSALKTATNNLIDQLSASAQNNGDVYISIVPFANVVNFGTAYKNSGYIDWSNWSTSGSIEEDWTCSSKYNSKNQTMLCGSSNNNINSWNGCVMDRTQSYDVQITPPTSTVTDFPADQSSYCPTVMVPLSYNWTALKASVSAMTPLGGTNQPVGLVWAWQTLQQASPFNAPAEDPNYTYKKAIILLSDGLNTMDRWYGDGSNPSSQVDTRQKLLCDNIKAAGVTIYTIQVNTGGDPTSTVLQYCASGASNFFMLTSASQVISTFNSIGTALSDLRISK